MTMIDASHLDAIAASRADQHRQQAPPVVIPLKAALSMIPESSNQRETKPIDVKLDSTSSVPESSLPLVPPMNLKSEPANVVNPSPRVSILSIKRELSTTKLQDLVVPNAPSVSTPNIGPVAPKQLVSAIPATTTPVLRRSSRIRHSVTADPTPSVTLVVVQEIDDHLLVLASMLLEILKLPMTPFLLKFIPPS